MDGQCARLVPGDAGPLAADAEGGGDKRICNLGSRGMTKLAVARLTECIMIEYGKRGVLALCIYPGAVMTALGGDELLKCLRECECRVRGWVLGIC